MPLRGNVEPELTGKDCECEGVSQSQNCKKLRSKGWSEVEITFEITFELCNSGERVAECGWRDFNSGASVQNCGAPRPP